MDRTGKQRTKQTLCTLFAAFALAAGVCVPASAETAGHIYYTDIKTYMKGELINSYNLGGETGIVCEDLRWYYRFDVEWKPESRELTVEDNDKVVKPPFMHYFLPEDLDGKPDISQNVKNLPKDYYQAMDGPVGEIAKDIYATDIQTYLNGQPIRSYNIDGQTVIVCEDLRNYGYDVTWDEAARTLNIWPIRELVTAESDLGAVVLSEDVSASVGGMPHTTFPYTLKVDGQFLDLSVPKAILQAGYQNTLFVPLQATLNALGIAYTWDGATNALAVTTSGAPSVQAGGTEVQRGDGEPFDELYTVHMHITVDGEPFTPMSGPTSWSPVAPTRREAQPVLYGGVVYLPLNAVADMIGYDCPDGDELVSR